MAKRGVPWNFFAVWRGPQKIFAINIFCIRPPLQVFANSPLKSILADPEMSTGIKTSLILPGFQHTSPSSTWILQLRNSLNQCVATKNTLLYSQLLHLTYMQMGSCTDFPQTLFMLNHSRTEASHWWLCATAARSVEVLISNLKCKHWRKQFQFPATKPRFDSKMAMCSVNTEYIHRYKQFLIGRFSKMIKAPK